MSCLFCFLAGAAAGMCCTRGGARCQGWPATGIGCKNKTVTRSSPVGKTGYRSSLIYAGDFCVCIYTITRARGIHSETWIERVARPQVRATILPPPQVATGNWCSPCSICIAETVLLEVLSPRLLQSGLARVILTKPAVGGCDSEACCDLFPAFCPQT